MTTLVCPFLVHVFYFYLIPVNPETVWTIALYILKFANVKSNDFENWGIVFTSEFFKDFS